MHNSFRVPPLSIGIHCRILNKWQSPSNRCQHLLRCSHLVTSLWTRKASVQITVDRYNYNISRTDWTIRLCQAVREYSRRVSSTIPLCLCRIILMFRSMKMEVRENSWRVDEKGNSWEKGDRLHFWEIEHWSSEGSLAPSARTAGKPSTKVKAFQR
jgi:hypothetical protein